MLREATAAENEAVDGFFDGMEKGLAQRALGSKRLAVAERDGGLFAVLVPQKVLDLPAPLLQEAEAGGLAIGTLEDGQFHLDLQGALLASHHTRAQTVRVTEHAARLFLYGRKILSASVTHHDPRLQKGDACIVANPRNEALGIGRVVGSFKGTGEAVVPIHDLGTYLRDQDDA
jgi:NOL1/NOP2/fmu family ribosome biogenesis protein